MTIPELRIITLLARHGTSKYPTALPDLRRLFAEQLPEAAHKILVIDNALDPDHAEQLAPDVDLIGGDNAAWEFSAWNRGVEYLGGAVDAFSLVHLATSAFRALNIEYLKLFDGDLLGLLAGRAAAIGHIDSFNEPVAFAGRSMQSWLRSSFMLMPPSELRLLRSLVSVTARHGLFSGNPETPFRADAPLSAAYQRNILGWLTGCGTGQGTTWHSRFDLSNRTLPFFEAKTMAILNEQILTSRLRTQGCAIVDATWLAGLADRRDPISRPLEAFPDWREQLEQRRIGNS